MLNSTLVLKTLVSLFTSGLTLACRKHFPIQQIQLAKKDISTIYQHYLSAFTFKRLNQKGENLFCNNFTTHYLIIIMLSSQYDKRNLNEIESTFNRTLSE